MRLIDAEDLKREMDSHVTSMSVCYSRDEQSGMVYMKERCIEDVNDAPSVDAIPVEWLGNERERALKEGMTPDMVEAIDLILWRWNKEKKYRQIR